MIFDIPSETPLTTSEPSTLLLFLPLGYLFTVLIEAPILVFGLSKNFTFKQRLFTGFWLTACTYPIVVLVLPILFSDVLRISHVFYLLAAETFAPVAECVLFWFAFRSQMKDDIKTKLRNFMVITVANLLSFGVGEVLNSVRWFGLF